MSMGIMAEEDKKSRVALVVQRYGKDIVGGAESHARILAQKLQQELGIIVEIYTTTARDYTTWSNFFHPGVEYEDGIQVRRFGVSLGRSLFFGVADRLIRRWLNIFERLKLGRVGIAFEWLWVYLQGPVCPSLVSALHDNQERYKKIIFFCYLYYPTLRGIAGLEHKSILVPLAHDEPPFHFRIVRNLLNKVSRMIPNTEPEWDMIRKKISPGSKVIGIPAGLGFEPIGSLNSLDTQILPKHGLVDGSYLLYLGRLSAGKGVGELVEWFIDWKKKHEGNRLKLVLAGHLESNLSLPKREDVLCLGYVEQGVRDALILGCKVLVNPSIYESLSMIVIEALFASKPVLARRQCAIFRYYAENVKTISLFRDSKEFEEAMDKVDTLSEPHKIEEAKKWVQGRFAWPKILEVFKEQIGEV